MFPGLSSLYLYLPTFMPFFLGPFGGVRATVALRPFLSELGMVILPSTVSIPTIQNSNITEEGSTEENERYLNLSQMFWFDRVIF
jgi:NAD(P)H-dependent FMN reductase